jgi:hypothetical protein
LGGEPSIFFINLPLGLLGHLADRARYASESTQSRDRPLDLTGQTAAIVAVAALAAAMIEGGAGAIGWSNPLVIAGFGVFNRFGTRYRGKAGGYHAAAVLLPQPHFCDGEPGWLADQSRLLRFSFSTSASTSNKSGYSRR